MRPLFFSVLVFLSLVLWGGCLAVLAQVPTEPGVGDLKERRR